MQVLRLMRKVIRVHVCLLNIVIDVQTDAWTVFTSVNQSPSDIVYNTPPCPCVTWWKTSLDYFQVSECYDNLELAAVSNFI